MTCPQAGRSIAPIRPRSGDDSIIRRVEQYNREDVLEQGGTADCKVSLADSQFYWRKGELRYFRRRVPQGGILPALGWQSYSGTITKSENGDIHFATLCYEKGLIFCVIPFWETFGREKFVLKMKPFQD